MSSWRETFEAELQIFSAQNFFNAFARFSLTKRFVVPQQPPIGNIIYPSEGVKNVTSYEDVVTPSIGYMWSVAYDGSRWFPSSAIGTINTPPSSSP